MEKLAGALEAPLYQLFYEGEELPKPPRLPKRNTAKETAYGSSGKEAWFLDKLSRLLGRMQEANRRLLFYIAQRMSRR